MNPSCRSAFQLIIQSETLGITWLIMQRAPAASVAIGSDFDCMAREQPYQTGEGEPVTPWLREQRGGAMAEPGGGVGLRGRHGGGKGRRLSGRAVKQACRHQRTTVGAGRGGGSGQAKLARRLLRQLLTGRQEGVHQGDLGSAPRTIDCRQYSPESDSIVGADVSKDAFSFFNKGPFAIATMLLLCEMQMLFCNIRLLLLNILTTRLLLQSRDRTTRCCFTTKLLLQDFPATRLSLQS